MRVRFVRIDKNLPVPAYHSGGAVAFDFYSRIDAFIEPRREAILPSNLVIEVPKKYALIIAARSSLFKRGLLLLNGIGVVDNDYHGPDDEIALLVYNFTGKTVGISRGDRLAQGLFLPVVGAKFEEAMVLKNTSRGGFGSTGR